jgi:hypothetical protein
MASTALFSEMAGETAHRLNYRYSAEANRKITESIKECLASSDLTMKSSTSNDLA